ncbi:anti-sigma factor [Micromonospora auratinigra]|uniref:Anti-sigma-K factor rskA n=1 Tax=Micromonospora auratinigra TaxID=261654 RepID=A0A1A9A9Y1_9ACTN|nr:anti-sigma factor [Micromonospora auratinigra]SBT52913.1 Anti-sigma-K factor rskA [Micromonospora auratinigra]
MQHLDHDRLVFLALGESEAEGGESTHLADCVPCRSELETLQHVAGLGADTQGLADLPAPPEHLWQGILAEVRAAEELPSLTDRRGPRPPADPTAPTGTAAAPLGSRRSRNRWPRWATTAVTATAAAALGVIGTLTVLRPAAEPPQPQPAILASANLAAYGSTPKDASGAARVLGDNQLHLHVANLPAVPGYYEVWLIDPRTMKMFSIGTLSKSSGDELLPMPRNVDMRKYSVVDISAEQYDNNTRHSGDSLLRGTLTG